jgi:hypothetical protein
MSEYTQCFVEKCIDPSVPPNLSDQGLEKPGVLLEHRRKMLRAISNLGDGTVFRVIREIQKRYFSRWESRRHSRLDLDAVGRIRGSNP